jgi:V8-like Glu-specific endopeptidase
MCNACASNGRFPEDSLSATGLPEVQVDDEVFTISNGNKDSSNRYASTVLILNSGIPDCSGVLIHRRLVLTAGHCVCIAREDKGAITLDNVACAKTATVTAVAYYSSNEGFYFQNYTGTVNVHRDFKAVLKKKKLRVPPGVEVDGLVEDAGDRYLVVNTVENSQADLALITLEEDAEILFPTVAPARTDIRINDPVVVVGYGADTVKNRLVSFSDPQPTRRFGKNRITQPGTEKFTIEVPGSLALPGDSGGPCFREDGQSIALVGISSRSTPGKKSTFTSTYHYLSWLDAEIHRANQL